MRTNGTRTPDTFKDRHFLSACLPACIAAVDVLARLRGPGDAVAAKIEPRRTREWVLCSLITAVYVSECRVGGIYAAFNCLSLLT